jgi:hypothetical protein
MHRFESHLRSQKTLSRLPFTGIDEMHGTVSPVSVLTEPKTERAILNKSSGKLQENVSG